MCNANFTVVPDKLGQMRRRYCGAKCHNRALNNSRKKMGQTEPVSQMIQRVSRPLYCPEMNASFSSVRKASTVLGLSMRAIYDVLAGVREDSQGLTFVDYDFHKHPMPRHRRVIPNKR